LIDSDIYTQRYLFTVSSSGLPLQHLRFCILAQNFVGLKLISFDCVTMTFDLSRQK